MLARLAHSLVLPLTVSLLLAACGDDQAGDTDAATEGEASTSATDTQDPTQSTAPTGNDDGSTSNDPSDPTSGDPTTGDPTGDPTGDEPSPYDGEPLPPADDGEWIWVDFPDAKCRDGSSAGIGVRYGSGPGLAIFFEGGGACFNSFTCGVNPANVPADFQGPTAGIFDANKDENPVGDWSMIYVPYCTGDVHAGARPDGTLGDMPGQKFQFVGFLNVEKFLQRIVPTFLGNVDQVLTTGVSAGGFGATFNYDRIADAFPKVPATLLDDSGPPMSDDFLAPCLQKIWRDAWGLDDTIPKDCTDCFPADGGGIVNLGVYLGTKHSADRLGLISSLGDNTIRLFFGFGNDDCKALIPSTTVEKFTDGLHDLRDNWLNEPTDTWGSFYIDSQQHTWIGGDSYYTAKSGGTLLLDWITELIGGNTSNVES